MCVLLTFSIWCYLTSYVCYSSPDVYLTFFWLTNLCAYCVFINPLCLIYVYCVRRNVYEPLCLLHVYWICHVNLLYNLLCINFLVFATQVVLMCYQTLISNVLILICIINSLEFNVSVYICWKFWCSKALVCVILIIMCVNLLISI